MENDWSIPGILRGFWSWRSITFLANYSSSRRSPYFIELVPPWLIARTPKDMKFYVWKHRISTGRVSFLKGLTILVGFMVMGTKGNLLNIHFTELHQVIMEGSNCDLIYYPKQWVFNLGTHQQSTLYQLHSSRILRTFLKHWRKQECTETTHSIQE